MTIHAQSFEAWLPFPPTANHRNRSCVVGNRIRTWNSVDYRNFQNIVWGVVQEVMGPYSATIDRGKRVFLTGLLKSEITVFKPKRSRADLDNIPKAIHDALERAGLFANDRQIVEVVVRLANLSQAQGGCHVSVSNADFNSFDFERLRR